MLFLIILLKPFYRWGGSGVVTGLTTEKGGYTWRLEDDGGAMYLM